MPFSPPGTAGGSSSAAESAPAPRRTHDTTDGATASVQFMITQRMRKRLYELGYSEADVDALDPSQAAAILRESGLSSSLSASQPAASLSAQPTAPDAPAGHYRFKRGSDARRRTRGNSQTPSDGSPQMPSADGGQSYSGRVPWEVRTPEAPIAGQNYERGYGGLRRGSAAERVLARAAAARAERELEQDSGSSSRASASDMASESQAEGKLDGEGAQSTKE